MSNSNVRLNDLARELEIKSRRVLEFLRERGIHGYTHTSWVNSSLAGELRAEFSDPPGKSEREALIELGVIRLRAAGDPRPAPPSVFAQDPHQRTKVKKKTEKKRQCRDCYAYFPKTEFAAHILGHQRKRQEAAKRAKPFTKIQPRTHLINISGGDFCETGIAQGVSADWDGRPLGTDRGTVGIGGTDLAPGTA